MENISNTSTVEKDKIDRVRVSNIVYRSIIVFLLFVIIGATFFIIGVVKKLSYIPEDVSSVLLETLVCINCEKEEILVEEETILKNEGWALYQYPKYGFFVELPSDIGYNDAFYQEKESFPYRWKIFAENEINSHSDIFSNYLERISITYSPDSVPSIAKGSSLGDGPDSAIYIDFYENMDGYTITQVLNLLEKYILELQKYEEVETPYEIKVATVLDRDRVEYEYSTYDVNHKGFIVLNKGYIVVIESHIYGTDSGHLDRANMVLESIRFE